MLGVELGSPLVGGADGDAAHQEKPASVSWLSGVKLQPVESSRGPCEEATVFCVL